MTELTTPIGKLTVEELLRLLMYVEQNSAPTHTTAIRHLIEIWLNEVDQSEVRRLPEFAIKSTIEYDKFVALEQCCWWVAVFHPEQALELWLPQMFDEGKVELAMASLTAVLLVRPDFGPLVRRRIEDEVELRNRQHDHRDLVKGFDFAHQSFVELKSLLGYYG